jgi:hypothetical protein
MIAKKTVVLGLLLACAAAAFAQNLTGLDRWITGFPKGRTDFGGHKITQCVIEPTGALVSFSKDGTTVHLNIIKPIGLDKLTAKYGVVENTILAGANLMTDKWNIGVKECEIDFGLKDEMNANLRISSFRFRLNQDTTLELVGRLDGDPAFYYQAPSNNFSYKISFKGIALATGNRDDFPGWPAYVDALVQWFRKGIDANNQDTLALVMETKVARFEDVEAQKRLLLSKEQRSDLWLGMNIDYLMPSFLAGERFGIYFNPFSYNMIQPMLYLSWRNLGDASWQAKPFTFSLELGGFFELNASYWARQAAGDFNGFPSGNGSFLIAYGPSLGVAFSTLVPRIVDNKHQGDLFGLGAEFLVAFNLPYFFPDYAYEYFMDIFLNFVLNVIPVNGAGLDVIVGFNCALATAFFDPSLGGININKFGLTLGVRLKLDFVNFYASNELVEPVKK